MCSIVPHPLKIFKNINLLKISSKKSRKNLLNLSLRGRAGQVADFDTSVFVIVHLSGNAKRKSNVLLNELKLNLWALSTASRNCASCDMSILAASFNALFTMSKSGAVADVGGGAGAVDWCLTLERR